MYAVNNEIIAVGRSEAARMSAAVAGADSGANVGMNVAQFAGLARLIENLCDVAADTVRGSMGDPEYWVPLAQYARLKREKQKLAAQCAAYEQRLTSREQPMPVWHDGMALRLPEAIGAPRPLM